MNLFLMICCLGIALNSLSICFDMYFLSVIGYTLSLIALFKIKLPGNFSKKLRIYNIIAIPLTIFAFWLSTLSIVGDTTTLITVIIGINIFFYIYFTYYLTQALISQAKDINELAITRNFQPIWTLNGIVAFIYFMMFMYLGTIVSFARIILLLVSVYYCFSIYGGAKKILE